MGVYCRSKPFCKDVLYVLMSQFIVINNILFLKVKK